MSDSVGLKMEVEDEEKFKAALKDISASVKLMTSEMKKLSADYNGNANSVDALTAKDKVLNQLADDQKKKVQMLREELDRAKEAYGENSTEVKELQAKLNDAETALSKTNSQVKNNAKYLDEAKSSSDGCATSIDKFGKQAKEAGTEVKGLGTDLDNTKGKASTFAEVLKANVVGQVVMDGVQQASSAMADFAKSSINVASDLAEVQNVVDVTFGASASEIDSFAQKAATSYGISELGAKQYAGTMGAMLSSMGLSGDSVTSMSEKIVGLSGDMASFYNLDPAEAFEKIRSGISGETEPLKQLGINMSVANLEAFAMSQGINTAYKDMSQSEQATLRYNYLLQATANAQGDFARTSGGYANQARVLQLNVENLKAAFGEKLLPALTKITTAFNKFVSDGDNMSSIINVIKGAAIGLLAINMTIKISSFVQAIGALKGALNFAPIIKAVGGAFSGLAGALAANPIILIIAGIAAAAILIIKNWGPIKDFFKKLWDDIKNIFSGVGEWFSNVFQGAKNLAIAAWDGYIGFYVAIWDGIKQVFSGVGNWFSQKFTEAKNLVMAVWNSVPQLFSGIAGKIGDAFSSVGAHIKSGFESGITFIKNLPGEAVQWGKDIINGIVKGIKAAEHAVGDAINGVAQDIRKFLHFSTPDEGPLADFDTYMPDMMQGMADGIRKNTSKVSAAARLAAASISDGLSVGTTVNVRGIASPYGAAAGGITTVNHTGVITIRGVNDQGQFVAAYDYVVDRMRREGRMA